MTYCRICNFLHFHNYKSNKSFTSAPTIDRAESIVVIDNDKFTTFQRNEEDKDFEDDNYIETVNNRGIIKSVISTKTVKIDRKQSNSNRTSQVKFNRANISKRNGFIRDHSRNLRQKRYERSKNLLILVSLTFVICW